MYEKLSFDETYRQGVRQLLSSGQFRIARSGRLIPMDPRGELQTTWVFTNNEARRKYCSWWNHYYFGVFGVIPRICRFNCWKTVIYPRNVIETFQLCDTLRALNLPSKCGADRRNYTLNAWGGFIYGDSLEEGREYYEQIRAAIDSVIGKDVRIILKRGCTEMERARPSNTWDDYTAQEKAQEWQLDDLFQFSEEGFRQARWAVNDVKEGWILRAIEIGDSAAREAAEKYSDDPDIWKKLVVHSVTYHNTNTGE